MIGSSASRHLSLYFFGMPLLLSPDQRSFTVNRPVGDAAAAAAATASPTGRFHDL